MLFYFQTDLSASQRWPLNSLASASTEPLSLLGSPPSSPPLESSERLSLGPLPSSAVEMTGLEIHSIRRSELPGLSDDTSAVTSSVSVRPSAGNTWLGRLKVSFSFPVLASHAAADDLADSVLLRTAAAALAILSLLIRSPSRQSPAAKRMVRSISMLPLVQPTATTPGADFALAIRAAA